MQSYINAIFNRVKPFVLTRTSLRSTSEFAWMTPELFNKWLVSFLRVQRLGVQFIYQAYKILSDGSIPDRVPNATVLC